MAPIQEQWVVGHCLVCAKALDNDNDSKAHIIPSALGGRLKPTRILCKACNQKLERKFDTPLVNALSPLMTLIGGSRDRGRNQPIDLVGTDGTRYKFRYGEDLILQSPTIDIKENLDSVAVDVRARSPSELRKLLGSVKAKYPMFNIEAALRESEVQRQIIEDDMKLSLQIGHGLTFLPIYIMSALFAVSHGINPHPRLWDFIKRFDPEQPTLPEDTFYCYHLDSIWRECGGVFHAIAMIADPERSSCLVNVNLFDIFCISVTFPYNGADKRLHAHAVDVISGSSSEPQIDKHRGVGSYWTKTHSPESLRDEIKRRVELFMQKALCNQKVHEIMRRRGFTEKEILTGEDVNAIVHDLAVELVLGKRAPDVSS